MFFRKKKQTFDKINRAPIDGIRWNVTDIYDKDCKEPKVVKTQRVLQYRRVDGSWEDVYQSWNSPIFLEDESRGTR